jgi:peptidoglycan hydrolase CwlO-like protein
MNTQFILLTQSATSAMIEIALLLLGAALIGFLIAWFFQKSVFTPIVNRLESEKAELNRKIDSLNNDISRLNGKINEQENVIVEKDKEIQLLKKPKK